MKKLLLISILIIGYVNVFAREIVIGDPVPYKPVIKKFEDKYTIITGEIPVETDVAVVQFILPDLFIDVPVVIAQISTTYNTTVMINGCKVFNTNIVNCYFNGFTTEPMKIHFISHGISIR